MARSFTSQDLIALPRLSAAEAVVLATQLITTADARQKELRQKELPMTIGRSKGRLAAARNALEAVTRPQGATASAQSKPKADRAIDNAWSAAYDWLSGWCRLPPERNPHREEAMSLHDLVFKGGLGFIKLPYKVEWKESKDRLDAISAGRHERTFKKLGGEAFLAHIQEAHDAYGRALHITVPKPEAAPAADVRGALLALLAALRDYATRVAAYADPDEPGSETLSAALLDPLATWESRPVAAGGGGEDEATPEAPVAPGEAPPAPVEEQDEPAADPA
ncbi:hypothetical protein [Sorangium sp. So ce1153]|uniref:hypothetical protein n=1 Tax=Sorangium sp. So ce1153 TaxID=3133333 RepID=UPI003F631EE0